MARRNRLRQFIDSEAGSAMPLLGAAVAALVLANSPFNNAVDDLLRIRLGLQMGPIDLYKPVLLWINDGLMAVFFLLVGLELKREIVEGALSQPSQVALPVVSALGGMAVPAAIYVAIAWNDPSALSGWAIPAATDIAFSLGVLAALGQRVPLALKVFLATLAIVDDLGAILIIAVVYTSDLSTLALVFAAVFAAALALLNLFGVRRLLPYLLVGVLLWVSVLKSGVHATLAGVVVAMFIPLKSAGESDEARPAIRLEHALKPWSVWFIMPAFAFANAGLPLAGLSPASLAEPVPLAIAAGLFLGKQCGIMLGAGLLIALGIARMPRGASWLGLYGVSILGGIGFTMSLFIGTLAFENFADREIEVRLGVAAGSLLSAVTGYLVLRFAPAR